MLERAPLSPHDDSLLELANLVEAAVTFHQALIDARGGLPGMARTSEQRVRELQWRLDHFATMLKCDFDMAEDVQRGTAQFHFSMMVMQQELGAYEAPGGEDLFMVDWLHQRMLDPTVDVRRVV